MTRPPAPSNRFPSSLKHISSALLPAWARRTNPLVRRHLHEAARREQIDANRLARLLLAECVLVVLSLPLGPVLVAAMTHPGLMLFVAPGIAMAYGLLFGAALGLPVLMGLYATLLVRVATAAAQFTLYERQQDRLNLLRTIPMPLSDILLSQIAAAIWNISPMLDMVLWLGGMLAPVPITIGHSMLWFDALSPVAHRFTMIAGLVTSFVRPWLELLMAGALGTLAATLTRYRWSAATAATLLLIAYFTLINLPRLLTLPPLPRLIVEIVLPLAMPPLVTASALGSAVRILTTD